MWAQFGDVDASDLTAGATAEFYTVTVGVEALATTVVYPDPIAHGISIDALEFELPTAPPPTARSSASAPRRGVRPNQQ